MAEIQESLRAELETMRAAYDMALARGNELQAHLNEARRRAEEFENQVLHARKGVKVGLVVHVYCNALSIWQLNCDIVLALSGTKTLPLECVFVDIVQRQN
jgi:hypothetical protein